MRKPCLFLSTLMISILRQDSGSVKLFKRLSSSSMASVSGFSFSTAVAASVMLSAETCAVPTSTISLPARCRCFSVSVSTSFLFSSVKLLIGHLSYAPLCKSVFKEHRALQINHSYIILSCSFNATKHIIKKAKVEVHFSFFIRIVYRRNALLERKLVRFIVERTEYEVFNRVAVHGTKHRVAVFLRIYFITRHIVTVGNHKWIRNVRLVFIATLHECFACFGPFFVMERKKTNAFVCVIILRVQLHHFTIVCKRFFEFILLVVQSCTV